MGPDSELSAQRFSRRHPGRPAIGAVGFTALAGTCLAGTGASEPATTAFDCRSPEYDAERHGDDHQQERSEADNHDAQETHAPASALCTANIRGSPRALSLATRSPPQPGSLSTKPLVASNSATEIIQHNIFPLDT